jgi:hypothetical protein
MPKYGRATIVRGAAPAGAIYAQALVASVLFGSPLVSSGLTSVADFYLDGGESSLTYNYKRFTGNGSGSNDPDVAGTVLLTKCHDITFNYCVFDSCTADNGSGKCGNTLKIFTGATPASGNFSVYNITFNNCLFRSAYRMGAEINGRGSYGYNNVDFNYCTFEPSTSEPVSYDDDTGLSGGCTFDHCVLGGGGLVKAGGQDLGYHQNFELNNVGASGRLMTVTNNIFFASEGDNWNLQMASAAADCGWVFSGNNVRGGTPYTDALAAAAGCPTSGDFAAGSGLVQSGDSNSMLCVNVRGGSWGANEVTNDNGWAITYFAGCQSMDLSAIDWLGDNNTTHGDGGGNSGITY